ncbi:MAG: hypothetical protein H0U50_05185 [Pyrinomonadaceae bacterium]|nr:hypothetical protein [Pyrinomonadaceae bacterium]
MKADFANLFSEPEIEDESVINDETYMEWLNRNTSRKAKYSRALLNKNISKVPNQWQEKLIKDLGNTIPAIFFFITFLLIQSTLTQGQPNSVIETRQIVQGNPFEREMKGGDVHRYQIT